MSGERRRRCSNVVLPLPRKPVRRLTGMRSETLNLFPPSSPLKRVNERAVERIARPAEQTFGSWPQGRDIVDNLGRSRGCAQNILATLPVGERESIVPQHAVGKLNAPQARLAHGDPLDARRIGPVDLTFEQTTQCTHPSLAASRGRAAVLVTSHLDREAPALRGERRLKSSAI